MPHNPGTNSSSGYYPAPYSVETISDAQRGGMVTLAVIGFFSAIAVLGPIWALTKAMIRHKYARNSQCLTLINSLMFADFFQALGFLFELHWVQQGKIMAPSHVCSVQGAFINLGDVANAFFVLAIALWTGWQIAEGRDIPLVWFRLIVGSIWLFAIILTIVGPSTHGVRFFTAAGSWCWISPDYEPERLAFHYVWVFIVLFLTFVIYGVLGTVLYSNRLDTRVHGQEPRKITRVVVYMFCYWGVYAICTLPIASGRMHSYAGGNISGTTFAVLGCFLASCGWMDCLMYNLTRWQDILEEKEPLDDHHDRRVGSPSSPSSLWGLIASEPKLRSML